MKFDIRNSNILVLIFGVYLILANIGSANIMTSLKETGVQIVGIALYFYLVSQNLTTRKMWLWLGLMLLYIMSVSILGNFQVLKAYFTGGTQMLMGLRVKSFVSNPNVVARHIVAGLPIFCAILAYRWNTKWVRWLCSLSLISLIVTLIFTGSRGALIATAASLIGFAVFARNGKISKSLALSAVLTFILLKDKILVRLHTVMDLGYASNLGRIDAWIAALRITHDFPVFGVGLGNFRDYYLQYTPNTIGRANYTLPHAHNTFLVFSSETGIMGAVLFYAIAVVVLWQALTYLRQNYTGRNLILIGLTTSLIGQLLFGMVEYMFTNAGMALIYYIVLAGVVRLYSRSQLVN